MRQPGSHPDAWDDSTAYEEYMGRWSSLVGRVFLEWLNVPPDGRWLDAGCGTGALSRIVLEVAAPALVAGIDSSPDYVAHARHRLRGRHAQFAVGDAAALPFGDGQFDVAVSGLVLNFVSSPERAVAEMARVVRSGGTVASYLWDYAGQMQLLRYFWDAAQELDPSAGTLDEGRRFAVCRPAALQGLFSSAGLASVESRAIEVPTHFHSFEDYWAPFTGGQGPAPSYLRSLDERRGTALRERLRAVLPTSADGSIELSARAWAIRGNNPER